VFFFKIYFKSRRSRKDVQEEVRLLLHLLADGIGVCEPIGSVKDKYVLSISAPEGERSAVLYRAVEGAEESTERHRRALGRMVAQMHQSADTLDPPYARDDFELEHVLDDNLAAIGRLMTHRADDFQLIRSIAEYARELVLNSLAPQSPEHGPCHGDLFGGDVLYSPSGEPVIFDFESSGTGWRALDIAIYGGSTDWMDTTEEGELRRKREVGQFLEGYGSVRQLTEGEIRVLSLDSAVHHIFLMGIVLRFWTDRDGWYWANDEFINWHMKWFRHWECHHLP
jgi:Ser/Thr protein kinase RdoA (MazF antagonist)